MEAYDLDSITFDYLMLILSHSFFGERWRTHWIISSTGFLFICGYLPFIFLLFSFWWIFFDCTLLLTYSFASCILFLLTLSCNICFRWWLILGTLLFICIVGIYLFSLCCHGFTAVLITYSCCLIVNSVI